MEEVGKIRKNYYVERGRRMDCPGDGENNMIGYRDRVFTEAARKREQYTTTKRGVVLGLPQASPGLPEGGRLTALPACEDAYSFASTVRRPWLATN
jgi:hypothetical protein